MGFETGIFGDKHLDSEYLNWLIDDKSVQIQRRFGKFWEYYVNRMQEFDGTTAIARRVSESGRCYVQAQEYGLPPRITGIVRSSDTGIFGGKAVRELQRKEVVIENDIGWRVNTGVDFLFGKPMTFVSKSPDGQKRAKIEQILKAVFAANGGIGFFQDMAVLGSVYGFVDCVLRPGEELLACTSTFTSSHIHTFEDVLRAARTVYLELIEAPRALPVLEEHDYRSIRYYVQHFYEEKNAVSKRSSFLSRILSGSRGTGTGRQKSAVTEIISSEAWQRYEDKNLAGEGKLPWGFIPVVHIQNVAQPYSYEGVSDVEPLIPLQDELNTRLSDRANRITFQSFKMYLGKGLEGFEDKPVAPGRMWHTDNPDAKIEEFGGDMEAPSEQSHIYEIRESLDKVSGITPLAAGVLKSKLGNLTSAVALRLTLMGTLSKTERKRFTYGEGLKEICRMVLSILEKAGVFATSQSEREVDIIFPSPLPENAREKLEEAQIKKELGLSGEQVLRELGYEAKVEEQ